MLVRASDCETLVILSRSHVLDGHAQPVLPKRLHVPEDVISTDIALVDRSGQ